MRRIASVAPNPQVHPPPPLPPFSPLHCRGERPAVALQQAGMSHVTRQYSCVSHTNTHASQKHNNHTSSTRRTHLQLPARALKSVLLLLNFVERKTAGAAAWGGVGGWGLGVGV